MHVRRLLVAATVGAMSLTGFVGLAAPAAHAEEPHSIYDCDGPEDPFNVIIGSREDDVLVGTDCNDAIWGRGGDDVIRGKLGYDVLRGNRGDDRLVDLSFLFGGVMRGGSGYDTCVVAFDTNIQLLSCEQVIEVG